MAFESSALLAEIIASNHRSPNTIAEHIVKNMIENSRDGCRFVPPAPGSISSIFSAFAISLLSERARAGVPGESRGHPSLMAKMAETA